VWQGERCRLYQDILDSGHVVADGIKLGDRAEHILVAGGFRSEKRIVGTV